MEAPQFKFQEVVDPTKRRWGLVTPNGDVLLPLNSERIHTEIAERSGYICIEIFLLDGGLRYNAFLGTKMLDVAVDEKGIKLAIDFVKSIGEFFSEITVDVYFGTKTFGTEITSFKGDKAGAVRWLNNKSLRNY